MLSAVEKRLGRTLSQSDFNDKHAKPHVNAGRRLRTGRLMIFDWLEIFVIIRIVYEYLRESGVYERLLLCDHPSEEFFAVRSSAFHDLLIIQANRFL